MSTLSNIKKSLISHAICEIEQLRQGNTDCANNMLFERIEIENRIFAIECLIAEDNSEYESLISFIFEHIKELSNKLTIKI